MTVRQHVFSSLAILAFTVGVCQGQSRNTAQSVRAHFVSLDRRILTMANDFPEDKYSFRLKPEMRTFGAVLVHIASGNIYAAKLGRGEKANWDEMDPKKYPSKAAVVAMVEKAMSDSEAALKNASDSALSQNAEPWLSVLEHSAEHYGLLVAYYRANGLVPPASRGQGN